MVSFVGGITLSGGITLTSPGAVLRIVGGAQAKNSSEGAAYVYNIDGTNEVKITAGSGSANDYFGGSVASSGSKIAAGARGYNSNDGRVYVYDNDGSNEVTIDPTAGFAGTGGEEFGYSLAMNSSKLAVGSPGDHHSSTITGSGALYICDHDGSNKVKIKPGTPLNGEYLGSSIALNSTKVIGGAYNSPQSGNQRGAAYIFNHDGTGEVRVQPSLDNSDRFGYQVAINSTKAAASAYLDDDNGSQAGAVYVFNHDGSSIAKIKPSDGSGGDYFGMGMAMSSSKLVVGAPGADNSSNVATGAVYVFDLDGTNQVKITPSDGTANDYFGSSVATDGTYIIVGARMADPNSNANAGKLYVYEMDGTNEVIIESSDGAMNDALGGYVAIGTG